MAQELQTRVAPLLPVLDLDRPTFLESVPSWLASRIAAESRSEHRRIVRDATGRQIGEVRTLPPSLMLNGAMRAVLTRRIAELEAALQPGPPEDTVEHIGLIINRYFAKKTADDQAVRAEIYLDVVDGLPAWTVGEAIRRWFRGKCGVPENDYSFAPTEQVLFRVAERIRDATFGMILNFRRLLAAEPDPVISEAVRERQSAALQAVVSDLRSGQRPSDPQSKPPAAPLRDRATVAADLVVRQGRREAWEAEQARERAEAAGASASGDAIASADAS